MNAYILDENKMPKLVYTLKQILAASPEERNRLIIEHGTWMEKEENRRVGYNQIGDIKVSTIFLGFGDTLFTPTPMLFETMTFPDNEQERYPTWEAAETGHRLWVEQIKNRSKHVSSH